MAQTKPEDRAPAEVEQAALETALSRWSQASTAVGKAEAWLKMSDFDPLQKAEFMGQLDGDDQALAYAFAVLELGVSRQTREDWQRRHLAEFRWLREHPDFLLPSGLRVLDELRTAFGTSSDEEVIRRSIALSRLLVHEAQNARVEVKQRDGTPLTILIKDEDAAETGSII